MKLSELVLQFEDFFRAIYNLILKVFQKETGWDGTVE